MYISEAFRLALQLACKLQRIFPAALVGGSEGEGDRYAMALLNPGLSGNLH